MDERTRRTLDRGRELYSSGDYDKAAKSLLPVLKAGHRFADVFHMMGVIYAQRGFPKRAQGMFEEALKVNPGYTEAAMNLAVIYNEEGRYEDARKVHQRLMAARPKAVRSAVDAFVLAKLANQHAALADAYEEAGFVKEAIAERVRALDLCPGFVDIRSQLAATYHATADLKSAVREYERVKKENARLVGPRLRLGLTYYALGRSADAAREWREVAGIEPENKFAKMYLRMVESAGDERPVRRPRA
jgi:tetratricopeptide (TPR) repeat protein